MARGLLAGLTDYSHQSFNDLLEDLLNTSKLLSEIIEAIEANINELTTSNAWEKQPFDFKNIINYSITHYKTSRDELNSIHEEIQTTVQEHHCKRLERMSSVGDNINNRIGKYWHGDFEKHKHYGEPEFQLIEGIYRDTRDMAATLLDLSGLATRLTDFIGKTSYKMEKKTSANFGNAKFGDNTVIVLGDNNVTSPTQIKRNDLEAFEKLLINSQVQTEDISEIKEILQTEEPDRENNKLGDKANKWITKMVSKSLDGSWAIGIGAAGKLLADAIKHYYGLFQ